MNPTTRPLPPHFHLGTSSWSSQDWVVPFYPAGTAPKDFLAHYATQFNSVEIDSTWYRSPAPRLVEGWDRATPDGFVFAAKVPRLITHEKALVDCEADLAQFVTVMDGLGPKLGPMLLQFEYIAKGRDEEEYRTGADFMLRLERFLKFLPTGHQFVVEVRNATWLGDQLNALLARHGVALALTDYFTMPPIEAFLEKVTLAAQPLFYMRFLGHHRNMDALVKKLRAEGARDSDWGSLAQDRTREMERWAPVIRDLLSRKVPAYAFFNNHYAGYAPGSIELFRKVFEGVKG